MRGRKWSRVCSKSKGIANQNAAGFASQLANNDSQRARTVARAKRWRRSLTLTHPLDYGYPIHYHNPHRIVLSLGGKEERRGIQGKS